MNQNDVFELCAYLAASAEGLKDEPKDYGPLRLLEILSRLANLAAEEYEDPFLAKVATDIKAKQDLVMTDRSTFYSYLGELVVDFAGEAKRRRGPQSI